MLAVSNFTIQETIGRGTFSKVKKVIDKNGEEFVFKTIYHQLIKEKDKFVIDREIQILKMLNGHSLFVKFFGMIETDYSSILVLEYVNGGDLLEHILKKGPLCEKVAKDIFTQILIAVDYMHSHFIIHRDLKPENILLTTDYNIKIADFGFSKYITGKNLLSTFCGSALYCSPEIFLQKIYIGPEIDIWAIMVILYITLVGYFPWNGNTESEQIKNILSGNFCKEPITNPKIIDLFENCFQIDPLKRYTIHQIFCHPWINISKMSSSKQELDREITKKLSELGFDNNYNQTGTQEQVFYNILKSNKERLKREASIKRTSSDPLKWIKRKLFL